MASNGKKEKIIECSICINPTKEKNCFRCFSCKEEYCLKCFKTYLLGTTQEPHCLHCRNVIDYNMFIDKFDKTWRLGSYKEHREKILWDVEQSLIPTTVGYIDTKKRYEESLKKRNDVYYQYVQASKYASMGSAKLGNVVFLQYQKERNEKQKIYHDLSHETTRLLQELNDFRDKKKSVRFKWSQPCPNKDCKGFLNDKYDCPICEKKFCKDCLEEKNPKEEHKCNEELVETVKMIRKESKPCPTCGEFISKISGCDQMFCTGCGTAFSWITGQKEVGVIHNPHAHQFFRNNPQAYEDYMAQRNGVQQPVAGGGAGACRPIVPHYFDRKKVMKQVLGEQNIYTMTDEDWVRNQMVSERLDQIDAIHRNSAEFHAYYRNRAYATIYEGHQENLDIREKFIQGEIDEKKFKMVLHMRNKKNQFRKLIHQLFDSTFMIVGGLLWNITETKNVDEFIKIYDMLMDIRNSTNEVVKDLSEKHNYKDKKFEIPTSWVIPKYWT